MNSDSQPDRPVIDLERALSRVADDRFILQELVDIFLRESPRWLDDLDEAIAAGDPEGVFRAAHDIKGSTEVFCADQATQAARQLERMGKKGQLDSADEAFGALQAELVWVRRALKDFRDPSA